MSSVDLFAKLNRLSFIGNQFQSFLKKADNDLMANFDSFCWWNPITDISAIPHHHVSQASFGIFLYTPTIRSAFNPRAKPVFSSSENFFSTGATLDLRIWIGIFFLILVTCVLDLALASMAFCCSNSSKAAEIKKKQFLSRWLKMFESLNLSPFLFSRIFSK